MLESNVRWVADITDHHVVYEMNLRDNINIMWLRLSLD